MAVGAGEIVAENVVVLLKKETTYGSSPSPGATNAVLVDRVISPNLEMETRERDVASSSETPEASHIGKYNWSQALTVSMRGSGTVDTPPDESPLYQACGLTETVNASTSVAYTPDASAGASAEAVVFLDDDHKFQELGYRGVFSISAEEVGAPLKFTSEGMALYAEPTNTASPGSESYDSNEPPVFREGSFTFDGNAYNLRSWNINSGAKLAARTKLGGVGGYAGWKITGFNPTGVMVVELDSEADENWFARAVTANEGAIDMTVGDTTGNQWDIDLPRVRVTGVALSEADGLVIATINYEARDSAYGAKDWITLTHK